MKLEEALKHNAPASRGNVHVVQRETSDVLEQEEALPFWSQDYTQLDKGAFSGAVSSVACHGVQIFRETMNRAVDQIACAPSDSYVIGLPTIIEGDASWGLQPVSEKNSLITLDKNAELLFRTSHLSEITMAVISSERLETYAAEVECIDLRDLMKKVNPVEPIPAATVRHMQSLLVGGSRYISKKHENGEAHQSWRHFEDELMATCLQALLRASECPSRNYDFRIHRHIVDRVRLTALSNHGESLTIGDLCTALRISRRTLNHAFIRVLGITPVTYIRNLRLQQIRAELQFQPFQVTTIADVAAKWGFWHMSLFSRYYRELFGECPSDTLDKARNLCA